MLVVTDAANILLSARTLERLLRCRDTQAHQIASAVSAQFTNYSMCMAGRLQKYFSSAENIRSEMRQSRNILRTSRSRPRILITISLYENTQEF